MTKKESTWDVKGLLPTNVGQIERKSVLLNFGKKYQLQAQNRIIQVADPFILWLTNKTCFYIRYIGKKWNIHKILLLIDKMKYQCIKQCFYLQFIITIIYNICFISFLYTINLNYTVIKCWNLEKFRYLYVQKGVGKLFDTR